MLSSQLLALAAVVASAAAQTSSSTTSSAAAAPTEVTDCHAHGDDEFFCVDADNSEWQLESSDWTADSLPDSFEGCHTHDEELHCVDGDTEATLLPASAESEDAHNDTTSSASTSSTTAAATGSSNGTATASSSSASRTSSSSALPTAVTGCHTHDETELYCLDGSDEWEVVSDWDESNPPESFDDCHSHGEELHCVDGDIDATLVAATADHDHDEDESASTTTSSSGASNTDDSSSAAPRSVAVSRAGLLTGVALLAYAVFAC